MNSFLYDRDVRHEGVNSGNQILDKKYKENIGMVSPDVGDPFKSIIEITESISNKNEQFKTSNEEFKTDKRTFGNNDPSSIYLFKVNNRITGKRCEICSKLTRKSPELRKRRRSGVFVVKLEHISHLFLVFLLFTLNK